MANARRSIIRPASSPPLPVRSLRRLQILRIRLERERAALARWQTRLKRAFNAVEKSQKRLARLERQLTQWEES